MGKVINFTEIKRRVVAAEASLRVSRAEGRRRSERLAGLLETVEENIARSQDEIEGLREERARADEEVRELKSLLKALLTLVDDVEARGPRVPMGEVAEMIKRLRETVSLIHRLRVRQPQLFQKKVVVKRRARKRSASGKPVGGSSRDSQPPQRP